MAAALSISMFEIEFLIEHGQVHFEHYNKLSYHFLLLIWTLFFIRVGCEPCVSGSEDQVRKDRFHSSISTSIAERI